MSKIERAMTAEEWAEITDPEIHSREKMLYEISYLWGRSRPHAVAALCLDGQSFGFTREMLVALREIIDDACVLHNNRCTGIAENTAGLNRCEFGGVYSTAEGRRGYEAIVKLADAVCDVIEALLPPKG